MLEFLPIFDFNKQNQISLQLLEIFGAGTAAVVTPVGEIHYQGKVIKMPTLKPEESLAQRYFNTIKEIQYGHVSHEWSVPIE